MSRIGKQPIVIPAGVDFELKSTAVSFRGPKGSLEVPLHRLVTVKEEAGRLWLETKNQSKMAKMLAGTLRSLLVNAVKGVTEGWKKEMELVGSGFRAELQGETLNLTLGFSHPVLVKAPEGIKFSLAKNIITVEGVDRAQVGQICAQIRSKKPPEPYKGKGIIFVGEKIKKKAGKAAKAQGVV